MTQRTSLTNSDVVDLTQWRRELHRHPELSGEEKETAARVETMLQATQPDRIVTGLGGHGVAALYNGAAPGPRLLLRCELDGLPIRETSTHDHRSQDPGKGHLCGHDGHMTIIAAMARLLGRRRPTRGSVVLMFQPAEENGAGAAAVVADPEFADLTPDYAFAIHNWPGVPLGHVALASGPVMCASRGMRIRLAGRTAHASQPENGLSPMTALSSLMPALAALGQGRCGTDPDYALATICHARLGDPAFGVAPGEADLYVTLRALTEARMVRLIEDAETLAATAARNGGLGLEIGYDDVFVTCDNTPGAVAVASKALDRIGIPYDQGPFPLPGSEDFGRFGGDCELAMLLLGSGVDSPALHNPDFDFPDDLIPVGARIFSAIVDDLTS
ncbi:amidohydrolase [Marimonas arenosa]|uniref:Amidohydrolase n=1 Tax=Marimonas arenosa TaxID=1795305 RepID=A0AAE3WDQ1_9RHOB|nr:amidohydrolase [Marimonas arenosa]MDQ2090525.1 amidohydrolase [Marimonas arenosa]